MTKRAKTCKTYEHCKSRKHEMEMEGCVMFCIFSTWKDLCKAACFEHVWLSSVCVVIAIQYSWFLLASVNKRKITTNYTRIAKCAFLIQRHTYLDTSKFACKWRLIFDFCVTCVAGWFSYKIFASSSIERRVLLSHREPGQSDVKDRGFRDAVPDVCWSSWNFSSAVHSGILHWFCSDRTLAFLYSQP